MARAPNPAEAHTKEQRIAREALERIAEWTDALQQLGQDTYALPDSTRQIVERIARGERVDPGEANHALEAADTLRSRCGWDLLDALRKAADARG